MYKPKKKRVHYYSNVFEGGAGADTHQRRYPDLCRPVVSHIRVCVQGHPSDVDISDPMYRVTEVSVTHYTCDQIVATGVA